MEVFWKLENFVKYFYTLNNPCFFGAIIFDVKINYRTKNQDCTPLTGGVWLKFSFRSF